MGKKKKAFSYGLQETVAKSASGSIVNVWMKNSGMWYQPNWLVVETGEMAGEGGNCKQWYIGCQAEKRLLEQLNVEGVEGLWYGVRWRLYNISCRQGKSRWELTYQTQTTLLP